MNEATAKGVFKLWNDALASGSPSRVAALYAEDAILLPTISNQVRHSTPERENYFHQFLQKGPQGELVECNVRELSADTFINSGTYEFTFANGSSAAARFTFVYRRTGNQWLIVEHHSSAMPE
ncbi:SgcJ/EcaC family oxidoreductase [Microbulbifer discodermiae]|uniref:SgcJ/EcaC family oxidoreductase n=1 Tax=Microbulbifer sp. 2201CG32-9 TaxID=3232309 RepID=UPI00345C037A